MIPSLLKIKTKNRLDLFKFFLILILPLLITQCSEAPQVSGIVAVSKIETIACVPREKTFKIRNNENEAQRVTGVYFEFGTNEDKYYKILNVHANGRDYSPNSNMVTDIILPPGAVLETTIEFNPRETTKTPENPGAEYATLNGYLSVMLGGPKLGVMQIEIQGMAPQTIEGCSKDTLENGRVFKVVAARTVLSHSDLGEAVFSELDVSTGVNGDFVLLMDGDQATLTPEGWPTVKFPLPPNDQGIDEVDITLDSEGTADFSGASLEFTGMTFVGSGFITLSNLTLTTGSVTVDSSQAPNVFDGSLTLQGSELDQGKMTLVVAAPLTVPPVDTIPSVGGGVFGLELELEEAQ